MNKIFFRQLDQGNFLFTGRGTTALWALLQAYNTPGKKVLVPVNVCEVVVAAILHSGMEPVYHDVNAISGNCNLCDLEKAYEPDVVIWLGVHNFGTPLDLIPMINWAKERKIFVIEDVCNALGATLSGIPVGSFGDAVIYSFGYAKILEIGKGGAVAVKNDLFFEKVKVVLDSLPAISEKHLKADREFQNVLRSIRKNSITQESGTYRALYSEYMNYMLYMPDQNLIGIIRKGLERLPANLTSRKDRAILYRRLLQHKFIYHRPEVEGDVYWRYSFLVPQQIRNSLVDELRSYDIPVSTWFPPVHKFFEVSEEENFQSAELFSRQVVNLWVDESITHERVEYTSNKVIAFLKDQI